MAKQATVKQEAFAAAMYTIGSQTYGNGTASARKAGYGNENSTDNYLAIVAKGNIRKSQIIALKDKIQAETVKKLDLSREKQHEKLEKAINMALTNNNPAAAISGIREENDMLGYHRENAPNQERIEALQGRISDEERRIMIECADLLLRKQVISTVKEKD